MSVLFIFSLTLLTLFDFIVCPAVNNRPVIGILAQASRLPWGDTYIPAMYVKYLEGAGARVVPIRTEESDDYYEKLFSHINGALFPGGMVSLKVSGYAKAARRIYDLGIQANDKGDYFPLWGTCLGFQLLANLTARKNLVMPTDAENLALPLNILPSYKASRLMGNLPTEIFETLSNESVTFNAHHYGIWQQTFESTASLNTFYRALSTNKDRLHISFISTMEAFKYPFYGSQWHPEANSFRWNPKEHMNHDYKAVRVSQYFANFFVNEARKSNHSFPNIKAASQRMIENFRRVFATDGSFKLNYFFNYTKT